MFYLTKALETRKQEKLQHGDATRQYTREDRDGLNRTVASFYPFV